MAATGKKIDLDDDMDDLLDNILTAVVLATIGNLVPSWLGNPKVRTGANVVLIGSLSYLVFRKIKQRS